eukprot:g1788.t1
MGRHVLRKKLSETTEKDLLDDERMHNYLLKGVNLRFVEPVLQAIAIPTLDRVQDFLIKYNVRLPLIFRAMDLDSNDRITLKEFATGINFSGVRPALTLLELRALFNFLDVNGDNFLIISELTELFDGANSIKGSSKRNKVIKRKESLLRIMEKREKRSEDQRKRLEQLQSRCKGLKSEDLWLTEEAQDALHGITQYDDEVVMVEKELLDPTNLLKLSSLFDKFCAFGNRNKAIHREGSVESKHFHDKKEWRMNSRTFMKMCRDCNLNRLRSCDIDILFSKMKKKNEKSLSFAEFVAATREMARLARTTWNKLVAKMVRCHGPSIHPGVSDTESVRFHDDVSTYTGVYQAGGPHKFRTKGLDYGYSNDSPEQVKLEHLLDRTKPDLRGRNVLRHARPLTVGFDHPTRGICGAAKTLNYDFEPPKAEDHQRKKREEAKVKLKAAKRNADLASAASFFSDTVDIPKATERNALLDVYEGGQEASLPNWLSTAIKVELEENEWINMDEEETRTENTEKIEAGGKELAVIKEPRENIKNNVNVSEIEGVGIATAAVNKALEKVVQDTMKSLNETVKYEVLNSKKRKEMDEEISAFPGHELGYLMPLSPKKKQERDNLRDRVIQKARENGTFFFALDFNRDNLLNFSEFHAAIERMNIHPTPSLNVVRSLFDLFDKRDHDQKISYFDLIGRSMETTQDHHLKGLVEKELNAHAKREEEEIEEYEKIINQFEANYKQGLDIEDSDLVYGHERREKLMNKELIEYLQKEDDKEMKHEKLMERGMLAAIDSIMINL